MRKFLIILTLVALCLGVSISAASAKADGPWKYQYTTQGFYDGDDEIQLDEIYNNTDLHMPIFYKWTHNMRLIKAKANTRAEYVHLKKFYKSQTSKKYPIIFCSNSSTVGYFIDLAFDYDDRYPYLNSSEKANYKSWAKSYVKRHTNCSTHRESTKGFQIYGDW